MPSAVPNEMGSAPRLDVKSARWDIPCLLCGSLRRVVMHEKAPFQIVRCAECGLVYTLPRLPAEAIEEMYQSDYWKSGAAKDFGYTDYVADEPLYVKTFRMRGELVARHRPPPARLLDVGCAAGFALTALRERGYDVRGVELSRPMAELARRRLGDGAAIHCGLLGESLFGGAKFDVITMFDVVEHVEDPVAFLATARRMLAPGGVVVLETQNVASWFARLMGVRWQHYKFHEHLYHFDPKTVRVLLAKAGLELVEWSPRRGGKHVSLRFLVERAGRVHPLLSTLLAPLRLFGGTTLYVNLRDEMLVVARPAAS
jgi:2-polyprenyl-3-methyl-5-hydroxy-6-metoxy-1,4-benzoquinol methylase